MVATTDDKKMKADPHRYLKGLGVVEFPSAILRAANVYCDIFICNSMLEKRFMMLYIQFNDEQKLEKTEKSLSVATV